MTKRFTMLVVLVLTFGCLAFSATHVFYGVVSGTTCGAKMSRASAKTAACLKKCVAGGASYVLVSRGKVYQIASQDKFAAFGGMRVRVHGSLSGNTITADSVTQVKSRKRATTTSSSGT